MGGGDLERGLGGCQAGVGGGLDDHAVGGQAVDGAPGNTVQDGGWDAKIRGREDCVGRAEGGRVLPVAFPGKGMAGSVVGFGAPRRVPSAGAQDSADGAGGAEHEGVGGLEETSGVLGAGGARKGESDLDGGAGLFGGLGARDVGRHDLVAREDGLETMEPSGATTGFLERPSRISVCRLRKEARPMIPRWTRVQWPQSWKAKVS